MLSRPLCASRSWKWIIVLDDVGPPVGHELTDKGELKVRPQRAPRRRGLTTKDPDKPPAGRKGRQARWIQDKPPPPPVGLVPPPVPQEGLDLTRVDFSDDQTLFGSLYEPADQWE
jgi:hypothetical protein